MPIVGISEFRSSGDDGGAGKDRVSGETLPPHGPGGIYHEKQIGQLCALHCVNNMLQGPLFDEASFGEAAQELDRAEREITGGRGVDGGNSSAGGFFNVQVMQNLLTRAGYSMTPVRGAAAAGGPGQADTARETAFILNRREHWFSLRRLGREWFDLNSCLRTPRHYTDSDLRFHIGDAVKEGYSVFVVTGDFPRAAIEEDSKKLLEAVQGCGRPGQSYSLFAGGGNSLSDSASPASAPARSPEELRLARLARFSGTACQAAGESARSAEDRPAAPLALEVESRESEPLREREVVDLTAGITGAGIPVPGANARPPTVRGAWVRPCYRLLVCAWLALALQMTSEPLPLSPEVTTYCASSLLTATAIAAFLAWRSARWRSHGAWNLAVRGREVELDDGESLLART